MEPRQLPTQDLAASAWRISPPLRDSAIAWVPRRFRSWPRCGRSDPLSHQRLDHGTGPAPGLPRWTSTPAGQALGHNPDIVPGRANLPVVRIRRSVDRPDNGQACGEAAMTTVGMILFPDVTQLDV